MFEQSIRRDYGTGTYAIVVPPNSVNPRAESSDVVCSSMWIRMDPIYFISMKTCRGVLFFFQKKK